MQQKGWDVTTLRKWFARASRPLAGSGEPAQERNEKEQMAALIRRLPERDKIVIGLYYYEGLTLKEIGEILGVSESWVSRLRTKAEASLLSMLKGNKMSPGGPD